MTLQMESLGSGPDLVLLHGWGFNNAVWQALLPLLTPHWRLHLIDLPGHGLNIGETLGEDITTVAEQLLTVAPPSAHYLGWSLGGTLAMAIALQYHHRLNKLVLVSSTPRFITSKDWPHGVDAAIFQQFGYDLINNYNATLRRFLTLQSLGNSQARQRAQQLQQQLATYPQPSSTTLARGLRLLEEVDFRGNVDQIRAPTLLIHSNNDKLVPLSASQFLHQQIPQNRLSLFNNSGHTPFIHQPEQFATEINQFLYE